MYWLVFVSSPHINVPKINVCTRRKKELLKTFDSAIRIASVSEKLPSNKAIQVRFLVFTAASMKTAVFWVVARVLSGSSLPTFYRCLLPPSSGRWVLSVTGHPHISVDTWWSTWMSRFLTDGLVVVIGRIGRHGHRTSLPLHFYDGCCIKNIAY
jgi:hypothetical protein